MKRKPKPKLFDDERRQQIIDQLPAVVSKIEVQKKDTGRISVFIDESTFIFGLPIHVCERIGISKGYALNETNINQIESEILRDAIRSWLLQLLAKRIYSRNQLERKCIEAEYNTLVTTDILNEFEDRKWIDDEAYTRAFVRDKSEFQRWGPAKIRQHLHKNGISKEITTKIIPELIGKEDQKQTISTLIEKRKRHFLREPDLLKRKKKMIDYLLRKGYDSNIVFGSIDTLINNLSE